MKKLISAVAVAAILATGAAFAQEDQSAEAENETTKESSGPDVKVSALYVVGANASFNDGTNRLDWYSHDTCYGNRFDIDVDVTDDLFGFSGELRFATNESKSFNHVFVKASKDYDEDGNVIYSADEDTDTYFSGIIPTVRWAYGYVNLFDNKLTLSGGRLYNNASYYTQVSAWGVEWGYNGLHAEFSPIDGLSFGTGIFIPEASSDEDEDGLELNSDIIQDNMNFGVSYNDPNGLYSAVLGYGYEQYGWNNFETDSDDSLWAGFCWFGDEDSLFWADLEAKVCEISKKETRTLEVVGLVDVMPNDIVDSTVCFWETYYPEMKASDLYVEMDNFFTINDTYKLFLHGGYNFVDYGDYEMDDANEWFVRPGVEVAAGKAKIDLSYMYATTGGDWGCYWASGYVHNEGHAIDLTFSWSF